jgi:hypothetical protein
VRVERRASVIVCDDILFGMTGKVFLQGVYTTDIIISGTELTLPQLVFYFSIESSKENLFKKLILKIAPPTLPPLHQEIPIQNIQQLTNPDRPKMIVRAPMMFQQIVLRPGKIETLVITESEELDAGGIWITSAHTNPS